MCQEFMHEILGVYTASYIHRNKFKYLISNKGHSTVPQKKGYNTPLNLNPSFNIVLILSVDVILMGFGSRLNRFYI